MTGTMEERVKQAQESGLDQQAAISLCSRLLHELETYLTHRRRRKYHTGFDDLLNDLLPGLAMGITLLMEKEASAEDVDVQERWGDLHPDMRELLQRLVATLGLLYAQRVANALGKEVERRLEKLANERTQLVLTIMEWGETQHYPNIGGDEFDIQAGIDAWWAFCGDSPIEQLQAMDEMIRLRQLTAQRRQRLAQLSGE